MPNRTEARSAKAALTNATGRLPLLRLFSTPLVEAVFGDQKTQSGDIAWSIRGDVKDIFLPRPEGKRDSVTSSPCSLCAPLASGFLPLHGSISVAS
jgi:hypothetical protein